MKRCFTCKEYKAFELFSKCKRNPDGYQRECKACKKIRDADYYKRNPEVYLKHNKQHRETLRQNLIEYKTGLKCEICNESRPWCLAFHHHNNDKDDAISQLVSRMCSWDRVLKEIEKCTVVCHNCHADIHHKERYI